MAQTLSKNDSAVKVLRAIRRHLKLARRTGQPGIEAIAQRIEGPRTALLAAVQNQTTLAETADDCFDEWERADRVLDSSVRALHRKAEDWDADHAPEKTVELLFQRRAPSEVTGAPRDQQPDLVAQIVARAKTLPAAHPGKPLVGVLTANADGSRGAHRQWVDALQKLAVAEADIEVAKLAAVRTYRDNAIDIERAAGEDTAELCFPTLRRRGKDEDGGPSAPGGTPES